MFLSVAFLVTAPYHHYNAFNQCNTQCNTQCNPMNISIDDEEDIDDNDDDILLSLL